MGRKRGGAEFRKRRERAIAHGKSKKTISHNVPSARAKLYRELELLDNSVVSLVDLPLDLEIETIIAEAVHKLLPAKPSIASDIHFHGAVRKFIIARIDNSIFTREAPVHPLGHQPESHEVPVVTID